nr:hypothetical protein [Sinirhodobacter populi]
MLRNHESSVLQYATRDRLMTLGWSTVEVIDEDPGRSAAGGVTRAGFDRMVAEVCLARSVLSPPGKCRASRATAECR